MEYQALYRKYRPKNFDDFYGQQITVKILKNAIKNNKVGHAYLFYGPRGTGKTSMAKIISRTINCLNLDNNIIPCEKCFMCIASKEKECVDILEIDAASNNGVDSVRELKNKINLVPAELKYKVYIIDEVHMLSQGAFNALLKTLEEPPEHVIFILATTELNKVPSTIISRCQTLEFKKIADTDMSKRIRYIAENEKINISENAIEEIVNNSDGGLRDALGLLEKLNSYSSEITEEDVRTLTGNISKNELETLIQLVTENNINDIILKINEYESNGYDLIKIINDLIREIRNIIINKNQKEYITLLENLITTSEKMKNSNNAKILLEVCFLNCLKTKDDTDLKNYSNNQKQEETIIAPKIERKVTIVEDDNISNLKQIRVNNTFATADKQIITNIRSNWSKMKQEAFNSEYGAFARILVDDANPVAAGPENIILTVKMECLERQCNNNLEKIEKAIYNVFNTKYKVIILQEEEWNNYISEYKKNKDSYKVIPEEEVIKTDNGEKTLTEKAKELFGDIEL